jgi:hypothetical protein
MKYFIFLTVLFITSSSISAADNFRYNESKSGQRESGFSQDQEIKTNTKDQENKMMDSVQIESPKDLAQFKPSDLSPCYKKGTFKQCH